MPSSPECRVSKLVAIDYSGIEAVLVGWFSRDPAYIRLARLGVHSYLCSHLVGRPASAAWDDARLAAHLKEIKKEFDREPDNMYDRAKKCIHGTNYKLTPHGMNERFPDIYPTRRHAEDVQRMYFELCPQLPRWQAATINFAAQHNYWGGVGEPGAVGVHPYGNVHWFWDVIRYRPITPPEALRLQNLNRPVVQVGGGRWFALQEGEDAKRCVANPPQSTAACIIKEAGLRLLAPPELSGASGENYIADCGPGGRNPLRALVHDEFLFEVPDRQVERVVERAVKEMCRPIAALPCPEEWGIGSHLRIGVEVMVGRNWDKKSMEKVKVEGIEIPTSPWDEQEKEDEARFRAELAGGVDEEKEDEEWSEEMVVALRG